jgi:hypothetical protein
VITALIGILDGAFRAGRLAATGRRGPAVPAGLAGDLAKIRAEFGLAVPDDLLARGALAWTSLFGAVSFEVFGQYGADTFVAREELFAHHLALLADVAGLSAAGAAP